EDQYGVGDVIDTGLAIGTVEGVSLRTTRVRDADGVVWHVPNGEIHRVGNSSQQWSRAVVDLALASDVDLDVVTRAAEDAATAMWHDAEWSSFVVGDPEVLGVESMSGAQMVVRVAGRTRPLEHERVARALRVRLRDALRDAGIPPTP